MRDFEQVVDRGEAEADAERLLRGHFGLEDLLKQLRLVQRMGPLREVFSKLPGIGRFADQVDESELGRVESLIRSMTPAERARPETIDKSRAARIARGSGRRSRDVRELVDRFGQMRQIMGSMGSAGGLLSRIPGLGRLAPAGAPDPSALLAAPGLPGGGGRDAARRRERQKGKRKQARKARKKNRRR